MRTGRPWDHSSHEQELLGMRRDCIETGTEPSHSHSSEDCTAVSAPVAAAAIGHSAVGCTSAAAGIGQHTTRQMKWPVVR